MLSGIGRHDNSTEVLVVKLRLFHAVHAHDGHFQLALVVNEFLIPSVGRRPVALAIADNGSLSTEQNPLHTYADTGSFQVTLTVVGEDGCSSSAEGSIVVIEDAVLSDDEVSARADTRLFIYPNPAQEMLYLSFDLEQPGLAQYYLADLLGRPVRQGRRQVASRQTLELSLADLPAGAYLLVVDIDGDRLARRVVKSR